MDEVESAYDLKKGDDSAFWLELSMVRKCDIVTYKSCTIFNDEPTCVLLAFPCFWNFGSYDNPAPTFLDLYSDSSHLAGCRQDCCERS